MNNPVAFSPTLKTMANGNAGKGMVKLQEVGSWIEMESLPGIEKWVRTLTYTWDGLKLIATVDGDTGARPSFRDGGPILMWEIKSSKPPITLGTLANKSGARCAAVSPRDLYFATGGWDGTIRLFDIAGRKELRQFVGQQGNICSICFSPDAKFVTAVSGALNSKTGLSCFGKDSHLRIWEVATGRVVRTIDGPAEGSWSVAWSPDGATIASGGEDGMIRLWHAASGRQRACLTGHDGPVTSLTFTPDGRQLFSGSADTTVLVWDLTKLPSLSK